MPAYECAWLYIRLYKDRRFEDYPASSVIAHWSAESPTHFIGLHKSSNQIGYDKITTIYYIHYLSAYFKTDAALVGPT